MRRLALLASLCSTAAWAEHDAVIWTSETTAEAAAAQLARAPAALKTAGLKLAEGWPRVVQSADVSGLKAGFHVVLIGYCSHADTTRALMRAKSAQRLAYVRKVTLTEAQEKEAKCPGVDPAVKPPPVPAWLVAATSKNKLELESRIESLKKGGKVELLDGWPKVVETRSLKIAVPPGKTAEKFLLVLGVCELGRADAVLGAADTYGDWPAWALDDVPMACPRVTDSGVVNALRRAVVVEDPELVKELAERVKAPADRADIARSAARANQAVMVRTLLGTFGKDPALATSLLSEACDRWGTTPEANAARLATVTALLEAGATATPAALSAAVSRCDVALVKLLLEKGATAKGDVLSGTLNCTSPDTVNLLIERGVVKLGGGDDGHTLILAPAKLRQTLLEKGASLAAKDSKGLGLLDLVLLFPTERDEPREQLLATRPEVKKALEGEGTAPVGSWPVVAIAATSGKVDAVKKALDAGGKADAEVLLDKSPLARFDALALAIDAKAEDAALLLLSKGARATAASGYCCESRARYRGRKGWLVFRGQAPKRAFGWEEPFRRERLAQFEPGRWWAAGDYAPELYPVSMTPLGRAALHGELEVVKKLLEAKAPLEEGVPALGLTPLMLAAQQNQAAVVDFLLEQGAKVDAVDTAGTPVLGHLGYGNADAALLGRVLKKKKGLAQVKGVLTLAALHSTPEFIKALIDAGAGKGGEGKAAAKAVCDSADRDLERQWTALEAAGFTGNKSWDPDCVQEPEGD